MHFCLIGNTINEISFSLFESDGILDHFVFHDKKYFCICLLLLLLLYTLPDLMSISLLLLMSYSVAFYIVVISYILFNFVYILSYE